ncbi:MAG: hypothetical protein LAO04_21580 [Acidobacteriia bacterium]|nr:hypothetical protein [Terriglobia bacterium]
MSCKDCPYFNTCSAPICPEDPESLTNCAWFPDEETCHRRDLKGRAWITRQRKIARVLQGDSRSGSFTFDMLCRNFRISPGLRGLDPEAGPAHENEKAWFKGHSEIRKPSEEIRQKMADLKARQKKNRLPVEPLFGEDPILAERNSTIPPEDGR